MARPGEFEHADAARDVDVAIEIAGDAWDVWENETASANRMTFARAAGGSFALCMVASPFYQAPEIFMFPMRGEPESFVPAFDRVAETYGLSQHSPRWHPQGDPVERLSTVRRMLDLLQEQMLVSTVRDLVYGDEISGHNALTYSRLHRGATGSAAGSFGKWLMSTPTGHRRGLDPLTLVAKALLENINVERVPPTPRALERAHPTAPTPSRPDVEQVVAALTPLLTARLMAAAESGVDLADLGTSEGLAAMMVNALPISDPVEVALRTGPFYTLDDTARFLGLEAVDVERQVERGDLLGARSRDRVVHVPAWQFDGDGNLMGELIDIAAGLGEYMTDWGVLSWLTQSRTWLAGVSPAQWVASGGDCAVVAKHARDDVSAWSE